MNNHPIPTAVLGAAGYTGQELVALLRGHGRFRLTQASSEAEAGGAVLGNGLRYVRLGEVDLTAAELVFSCLPAGESGGWAKRARDAGARVVDLSADLRAGEGGAVYGVPELWRDEVRGRVLVANPGCYPTGILLTLAPLLAEGFVDAARPVVVVAASGVTGAGRTAKRELMFGEVSEDYRAYGVGNTHRHVPEIVAGLRRLAGDAAPDVVFAPHLMPVRRGILETMHVPVRPGVGAAEAVAACAGAYASEPFVEIMRSGLPSLRQAVGRNTLVIGFSDVAGVRAPLIVCVAAFDNLLKGAAGQALQNANLMFGLSECEGIPW